MYKVRIFWKNLLEMIFKNGVKNIQALDYNGTRMLVVFCFSLKYIYVVFYRDSHIVLLRMNFVVLVHDWDIQRNKIKLLLSRFETCYSCKWIRVFTLTIREIMQQKLIKTPLSKIRRTIVIWGNFAAVCVCTFLCL